MIRLARSGLGWLCLLPCLFACRMDREAEAQKSAARVARAVEVLRLAPNPAKGGLLAELGKVDCVGSDVCATRDVCLLAYRLHVDALALTEVAKQQVASVVAGNAGKLLSSAEQKLTEAGVRVADCVGREAALRHRYKL